eukprot:6535308-Prorocentrum_lima.AAC.1
MPTSLQPGAPTLCHNIVLHSGERCGHALGTDALHHLLTCQAGPGRNARHNRLRDFLAKWLQERMLGQVRTEQVIDSWVKTDAKGTVIQGKRDVAWQEGKKEHTLD